MRLNHLSFKIMIRIDIDKIVPSNCPFGREDCIQCGSYELAHDEIICHEHDSDCCDNENIY